MAVHRRRPGLAMLALATVLTVPLALLPIARAVAFEPGCACEPVVASPVPGIEVLLEEHLDLLRGKRVGLVTNPTGVDRRLRSTVDLLAQHPDVQLVALFGPEHGVRGDAQAGAHVGPARDRATGLPVHSLYGEHREPTPAMLEGIEVLVFDLQDVGARFYTYPYTLAGVLRAARRAGIPVIVPDRPNPVGGLGVEGPVLEPEYASFVGMFPVPIRHGMTLGELARLFNQEFGIGALVDGASPQVVIDEAAARQAGASQAYIDREVARQLAEIERRRTAYCSAPPIPLQGRTVIVVDDGIATGGTVLAALKALARIAPRRIVLAVPLAPRDVLLTLGKFCDDIVCLSSPDPFFAVGAHYRDFSQTEDEEVIRLLAQARDWT